MSSPRSWQDSLFVEYKVLPDGNVRAQLQMPYGINQSTVALRPCLGARYLQIDVQAAPHGFAQGAEIGSFGLPFTAQRYGTSKGIIPAVLPLVPEVSDP